MLNWITLRGGLILCVILAHGTVYDWRDLPHHMMILRKENYWAKVHYKKDGLRVVCQRDDNKYTCLFMHATLTGVRYIEVLVEKKNDHTIYIAPQSIFFKEKKILNNGSIKMVLAEDPPRFHIIYKQVDSRVYYRHKMREYPGEKFSLRICESVLCIFVGDQKEFEVFPQYDVGVKFSGAHFTPVFEQRSPAFCEGIKAVFVRRLLPQVTSLLLTLCYGERASMTQKNDCLIHWSCVLDLPQGEMRRDFEWMGKFCQKIPRKSVVRLYSSAHEVGELHSDCNDQVTITTAENALKEDGTPYPIMHIKYGHATSSQDALLQDHVLCVLNAENDNFNMGLYAASTARLLMTFCFKKCDLNRHAKLQLYCVDESPHFLYPIAKNLSIGVCLGGVVKDGSFYIYDLNDNRHRVAFFAANLMSPWMKQFVGVPTINLADKTIKEPNIGLLNGPGETHPILAIRSPKNLLNLLLFDYTVLSNERGYCMCIRARVPSQDLLGGIHEINVQLRAEDVGRHPLNVEYVNGLITVHISPINQLCIVSNKKLDELSVGLAAEGFQQEMCRFAFLDNAVLQKSARTFPIFHPAPDYLSSNVAYLFSEREWGLCSSNVFVTGDIQWCRVIQFLMCDRQVTMLWSIQDDRTQEKVTCEMCVKNEKDILCFYAYHNQKGSNRFQSCGALSFNPHLKTLDIYKASEQQCHTVDNLSSLTGEIVRKWDVRSIVSSLDFTVRPRFIVAKDGVRALFKNADFCLYFGPIKRGYEVFSLKTLFVEIVQEKNLKKSHSLERVVDQIEG